MAGMSEEAWPEPSPEGIVLIERVYRFAVALKIAQMDRGTIRPALIITVDEALSLVDHQHNGPWRMAVYTPSHSTFEGVQVVRFDLATHPQPGVRWATLFGISLIIEDDPNSP